jgi:hypothetical protein
LDTWYRIDSDLGCIFVKRAGRYAHDEWMNVTREINSDTRVQRGMNSIYDLREAEGSPTTEQIRQRVQQFNELDSALGPRKVAIVAPGPGDFGMSRMYGILRGDSVATIEVFKIFQEAKDWIGLPADFEDPFPR